MIIKICFRLVCPNKFNHFKVVYFLHELEGDDDVFSISTHHGKGTIRLVKNLDYETKSLYQLRVLAVDRANQGPINTGTAAILVKVRDVDDVSNFLTD